MNFGIDSVGADLNLLAGYICGYITDKDAPKDVGLEEKCAATLGLILEAKVKFLKAGIGVRVPIYDSVRKQHRLVG